MKFDLITVVHMLALLIFGGMIAFDGIKELALLNRKTVVHYFLSQLLLVWGIWMVIRGLALLAAMVMSA